VPFRGDSTAMIFDAILNRAPVAPVRLNPDLPPELERIISRALEKDRELRYQHASEMRAELQRLKRDTNSSRSPAVAAETGVVPSAIPATIPAASGAAAVLSTSASGTVAARPSSSGVAAAEPARGRHGLWSGSWLHSCSQRWQRAAITFYTERRVRLIPWRCCLSPMLLPTQKWTI
jgi:eukaryotic-like serine/threonine-protein kinase